MRAVTYTLRDAVSAPVNQVFAVLTDPGGMAACFPGADTVTSAGPLEPGASITVRFGARVTEFEVVAYTEPSTVGWVERGGRRGWRTVFNLDPSGSGTALTIRNIWAPHSFGAWLRGRVFGKREVEQHLERILDNVLHALFRERPSF
jgi:carbon monoxide dehydrogenase subunit G